MREEARKQNVEKLAISSFSSTAFCSHAYIPKKLLYLPRIILFQLPLPPMSIPISRMQDDLPQVRSNSTMDLSSLPSFDTSSSPGTPAGLVQPQEGILTGD